MEFISLVITQIHTEGIDSLLDCRIVGNAIKHPSDSYSLVLISSIYNRNLQIKQFYTLLTTGNVN